MIDTKSHTVAGHNRRLRSVRWMCLVTAGISALAMESGALAQAAASGSATEVADIIVTARKRAETLQSVPVAVSAFSGAQLTQKNITDIRGLALSTPGLVLVQGPRSSTLFNASLRGQVSADSSINADSPIGLYVDNVYIGRTSGAVTTLFDVENVQVLRGVQGTLFGRNNTGGAILITTVKPQNQFDAKVNVGAGNYDMRKFDGMVNIPVIDDKIAARVSASYQYRHGWLNNVPTGKHLNSLDIFSLRSQLRVTPTDRWDTVIRYSKVNADNTVNMPVPTGPGLGNTPPVGFYTTSSGTSGDDSLGTQDISLDSTYEFSDAISSRLTLANRQINLQSNTDGDGYPVLNNDVISTEKQKQNSAELQLSGKAVENRLNWVLGGFYFRETGTSTVNLYGLQLLRNASGRNQSTAGYAHADFDLFKQLSVGGGVRYTKEKRRLIAGDVFRGACLLPAALRDTAGVCKGTFDARYGYWSWDATINYKPTRDLLIYARAGRGQKAGGFNLSITALGQQTPYRPEVANDIEGGIKATWLDGVLRTNLAVYRTKYSDIQRRRILTDPLTGGTVQRIDNAAKATIKGVEAEVFVKPIDLLTLEGTFAYTDAQYDRFVLSDLPNAPDLSANRFPLVAKYTYSLGGTFNLPLSSLGTLSMHADYSYRSRTEFIVVNVPGLSQKGFGQLNGRVSLPLEDTGATVSLFGTNLTNKKYNVNATQLTPGQPFNLLYRGTPRLYGIELSWAFGGR